MAQQSPAESASRNGHTQSGTPPEATIAVERAPASRARRRATGRAGLVTRQERPPRGERLGLSLLRRLGYQVSESRDEREVEFLESAPELVAAIRSGHPRFAHLALAACLARSDKTPPKERAVLRREYPLMFQQFERKNGRIVRWYTARQVFAAAALTEQDDITVTLGRDLPAESEELVDLLRRCQEVAYTAWHRLTRFDRRQCQNMIFSVIEEALRQLDAPVRTKAERSVRPLVSG